MMNSTDCFDVIHTDVWGISSTISHSHYKYFVTYIDGYSRFTWMYFLHIKSEVFDAFKKFLAIIENQFSKSIEISRSDLVGEYAAHPFRKCLRSEGIISQKIYPYII